MSHAALDKFGQFLIHEVRDRSIADWENILTGKMKSERGKLIFQSLSSEQREALLTYTPAIVDTTLHFLLSLLDWREDMRMSVDVETGASVYNISEVSDGLPQELIAEDGWISRFSTKPTSPMY